MYTARGYTARCKKERAMDTDKLAQKLAAWIKENVKAAGAKGAVFGMSGGIDSR